MIRNFYTGEITFNDEEVNTVSLAIDARCEQCLNLYRSVPDCPARDYFGKEYLKANALYKELFGTEYPASTEEGDVPGIPSCTTC